MQSGVQRCPGTLHGPAGTGSFRLHFNSNQTHVRDPALLALLAACRPAAPAALLARRGGPSTLVMERRADGWKILHDRSSSDPK
jgi:ketosteroid isomerase-like protein